MPPTTDLAVLVPFAADPAASPAASASLGALVALTAVFALAGALVGTASGRMVALFPAYDPDAPEAPGPDAAAEPAGPHPDGTDPAPGTAQAVDDPGPPPPHCPHCAAEVRFLPGLPVPAALGLLVRGTCPACGEPVPGSPVTAAVTALAFGLLGWGLAGGAPAPLAVPAALPLLLAFCAAGAVLAVIDARVKRLPNAIVLRSLPLLALLAVGAVLAAGASGPGGSGAEWTALRDAAAGAAGLSAFYFVLWFIYPAGMGWGDVKLALPLGLVLGLQGLGSVVSATLLAFISSGLLGLGLIALRLATRKTEMPLGPFMLGAALAVLVAGDPLAALAAA